MSTQKTNVREYNYFRMYSSMITIILECNYDYFHEYPVSTVKAIFIESLGVTFFMLLCHTLSSVPTNYCYTLGVIIIYNQTTFSGFE